SFPAAEFDQVKREMTTALYFTPTPLTPAQAADLKQIVTRVIEDPTGATKYTGNTWSYVSMAAWERIVAEAQGRMSEAQVAALRDLQQQSKFWHAQLEASKAYRAKQAEKQPAK
ncbi:MAG: hypothetical protein V4773_02690, partial [Verrucomicrobiota bacterium]